MCCLCSFTSTFLTTQTLCELWILQSNALCNTQLVFQMIPLASYWYCFQSRLISSECASLHVLCLTCPRCRILQICTFPEQVCRWKLAMQSIKADGSSQRAWGRKEHGDNDTYFIIYLKGAAKGQRSRCKLSVTVTNLMEPARLTSTAAALHVLSLQFTVKLFYDLVFEEIIYEMRWPPHRCSPLNQKIHRF